MSFWIPSEQLNNGLTIFCLFLNRVCGSYANMNAGNPAEALVDFTGGVHICYEVDSAELWNTIHRAAQSKSLICCGTPQGVKLYLTKYISFNITSCQIPNIRRISLVSFCDCIIKYTLKHRKDGIVGISDPPWESKL